MDMRDGDLGNTYVKRIHVGNLNLSSPMPSEVTLEVKTPKQCTVVGLGNILKSH